MLWKQSKWWIDLRYMWVCIQYEYSRETITNRVFRLQYTKQQIFLAYMELMRCMTDHSVKPLSSFENKQRSFSNISYIVFFTYFTIYGDIITGLYQVTL